MRTYDEIAQSVIRRAKSHKAIRNRCILGVTAAVCVLGICLGFMATRSPVEEGKPSLQAPIVTDPTAPQEARVTLLYNDGSQTTQMQADVMSPCRMEVRVRDVRDLTEEEKRAVCEEEKEYAREVIAAHPEAKGYQRATYGGDNVVMTTISAGHFILGVEDPTELESIHASVEGVLQLCYLPPYNTEYYGQITREYLLERPQLLACYYEPYGGFQIGWVFSSELFLSYDEDPVSLSNFRDTITITVTFRDGTVEEHAIDILFDDDGQVYALYRNEAATV